MNINQLNRIRNAREALGSAIIEARRHENGPADTIMVSQSWVDAFRSLKDAELFCPLVLRSEDSTFYGVHIQFEEYGNKAAIIFKQGGVVRFVDLA